MRKKIIGIVDFICSIINTFFKIVFFPCPIRQNRIVFINFNGKGYGCNPKYICDYLRSKSQKYDLIWFVSNQKTYVPEDIKKVNYNSLEAIFCMATAKIIITNTKNDLRFIKKSKQKVFQTWHASYSPKYLERVADLSKKYKKESRRNSKQTDYFLSNSKIQTQEYKENFWCECQILETGYPRNDLMFQNSDLIKNKVRNNLGLDINYKVLLYAPTFRDDYDTSAYFKNINKLKQELEKYGDKWKILIRLHPNAEKDAKIYEYNDFCINATNYPDMQELLVLADILITDYSSSMFDFSILNKPVFIYATDIIAYTNLRGLKPVFYELPFSISVDEQSLYDNIRNYSDEEYQIKVDKYLAKYGNFDDGHATERVCKIINMEMNLKV